MREFILILWYMTVSVSYSHLLLTSTPAFSWLTFWASDTTSCLPYPLKPIVLSYVTCPQLSIPSYLQDLLVFFPPYFHYHLCQEYRGLIRLSPVSYCQPSNCLTNFYHLNPFGQFYPCHFLLTLLQKTQFTVPILTSSDLLHCYLIIRSILATKGDHGILLLQIPSTIDIWLRIADLGTFLVVQWLRLHAPNAGGPGSIPGQGTRSLMLQLKIPHTATEIEDLACHNWDPAQPSELKNPSPIWSSPNSLVWCILKSFRFDPPLCSYLTLCVLATSTPLCGCMFLVSMLVHAFSLNGTSSPSYCILFTKRFLWPFTPSPPPCWAKYIYRRHHFFSEKKKSLKVQIAKTILKRN